MLNQIELHKVPPCSLDFPSASRVRPSDKLPVFGFGKKVVEFHPSSYRFLRRGNSKHKDIWRSSCEGRSQARSGRLKGFSSMSSIVSSRSISSTTWLTLQRG